MAELDLDALEQAARDAGGGCWFSTGWTVGSRGFEVGDLKSRDRICSDATERCAEFIAAANPATILELLDRLEAAEKERDALRNEIAFVKEVEFPRKAQAVADAWEGKCKRLEVERDALRAKIAEVERQETALRVTPTAYRWRYRGAIKWQYGELTEEAARLAKEHNHEVQALGILPDAQGEEK